MTKRAALRTTLMALAIPTLGGCAHTAVHDVAWGRVDGPMCTVQVESGFPMPVTAAARTGGREIELGTLQPESAHRFEVPCAHRAVTAYRVIRVGPGPGNELDAHTRALDEAQTTVVMLRPHGVRTATGSH